MGIDLSFREFKSQTNEEISSFIHCLWNDEIEYEEHIDFYILTQTILDEVDVWVDSDKDRFSFVNKILYELNEKEKLKNG